MWMLLLFLPLNLSQVKHITWSDIILQFLQSQNKLFIHFIRFPTYTSCQFSCFGHLKGRSGRTAARGSGPPWPQLWTCFGYQCLDCSCFVDWAGHPCYGSWTDGPCKQTTPASRLRGCTVITEKIQRKSAKCLQETKPSQPDPLESKCKSSSVSLDCAMHSENIRRDDQTEAGLAQLDRQRAYKAMPVTHFSASPTGTWSSQLDYHLARCSRPPERLPSHVRKDLLTYWHTG